ncbi:hypothetical protein ACIPRL_09965 [Streptomyces sp. NPDC090085]|uniref:hypothetical protein n=1 Tax=Streptomyces sp. NPDC090085 TaxID=3365943 RepID=UPI0037F4DA62
MALELVRAMLRDQGVWCRLEAGDAFTVHVGWDQYVYVGSAVPSPEAVARTRELGLLPAPMTASPYAADLEEPEVTEIADEDFWARLRTMPWRRPTSATPFAGTVSHRRTSTECARASAPAPC